MIENKIRKIEVLDIRVPTSKTGLGSDPFHTNPDYSAVVTIITTESDKKGLSIVFTCGLGNEWILYGIKQLSLLVEGYSIDKFIESPGTIYKKLINHPQLRWLGDGVFRMAVGGIINAMWDLWGAIENKPMWELILEMSTKKIIESIDWRYLKDIITTEEASEMINSKKHLHQKRKTKLEKKGVAAYMTVGWSGLSDSEIKNKIRVFYHQGISAFKIKVGSDIDREINLLKEIRSDFGDTIEIMLDSNQIWGVNDAIYYIEKFAPYKIKWIEEPTARDDIIGTKQISEEIRKFGIGVAAGEQMQSPVIFKQMLNINAIQFCQIDAARLGGVNEVLPIILIANKKNIPICPHGGGIGLCNMVIHFAVWDQIAIANEPDTQLIEYLEFLQDDVFLHPISLKKGNYSLPNASGWGIQMNDHFLKQHSFPNGVVWKKEIKF